MSELNRIIGIDVTRKQPPMAVSICISRAIRNSLANNDIALTHFLLNNLDDYLSNLNALQNDETYAYRAKSIIIDDLTADQEFNYVITAEQMADMQHHWPMLKNYALIYRLKIDRASKNPSSSTRSILDYTHPFFWKAEFAELEKIEAALLAGMPILNDKNCMFNVKTIHKFITPNAAHALFNHTRLLRNDTLDDSNKIQAPAEMKHFDTMVMLGQIFNKLIVSIDYQTPNINGHSELVLSQEPMLLAKLSAENKTAVDAKLQAIQLVIDNISNDEPDKKFRMLTNAFDAVSLDELINNIATDKDAALESRNFPANEYFSILEQWALFKRGMATLANHICKSCCDYENSSLIKMYLEKILVHREYGRDTNNYRLTQFCEDMVLPDIANVIYKNIKENAGNLSEIESLVNTTPLTTIIDLINRHELSQKELSFLAMVLCESGSKHIRRGTDAEYSRLNELVMLLKSKLDDECFNQVVMQNMTKGMFTDMKERFLNELEYSVNALAANTLINIVEDKASVAAVENPQHVDTSFMTQGTRL